jgi:Bifunctional DNA primase/polymerase, N-terminal
MTPNPMHTAALAAVARGWHVFPLVPGTKRPAVRAWEQRATTEPDRITHCWQAGAFNVALACGPSGLVVMDLDAAKSGEHPPSLWADADVRSGLDVLAVLCEDAGQPIPWDTYTVATPSGGRHLYFTAPPGSALRNTAGTALGWKIDTRAHGGYVVAAGSRLDGRAGGLYDLRRDQEPVPLPGWLFQRLSGSPLPPQQETTVAVREERVSAYLRAALDRELARVLAAPTGRRNHALYLSAVALGQLVAGGWLEAEHVSDLLEHAGRQQGLGALESARTIASGLRAGAKRPRQVAP